MKKRVRDKPDKIKIDNWVKGRLAFVLLLLVLGIYFIYVVLASPDVSSDSNSTSEWRMFGRYLNHTRYTSEAGPTTNTTLWNYTTGNAIDSSPTVANGIVYIGSTDKNVYALNATNGSKIWNYSTGDGIDSSLAVADDIVYVGSWDKNVYALNATNGSLIWNYTAGDWVTLSSPAVANGIVYIGSDDKNVYALNATNGSLIWNYTIGDYIYSSPAVANGIVYIGSNDNNVYALNATNGSQIWNYTTGNDVDSSPAVADDIVYIGSWDKNVYALNATNGSKIWNYTTGAVIEYSSPAVANGIVYIGSDDKNVYALNATNGSQIWNYTTSNWGLSWAYSSPAVANDIVYIGCPNDYIYALNATNGSLIWNYLTGDDVFSSPAVANGIVYIGSDDNKVYAFGDLTAPAVNITAPTTGWYHADFVVNATVTDAGSGVGTVRYRWENSSANGSWTAMTAADSAYNATFNVSAIADGNYTIRINATDNAGNSNTSETVTNVGIDTTAPTVSLSCSPSSVYLTKAVTCTCTASDATSGINESSYSYALSSSTSSSASQDTSTTGTFTEICTVSDNGGNSNSATASYTVSSPGGGFPPEGSANPKATKRWDKMTPGVVNIIHITDPAIGFNQITIEVKNEANHVSITITKLSGKPASITKLVESKVYSYMEIKKENLADENIEKASISFTVNKSWLESNNLDKNAVVLNRYTEAEKWEELPTKLVKENAEIEYEASTKAFSVFAVSAKEKIEGELCGNGIVDEGENCENCPEDVKCAADEECKAGACVKKAAPPVPAKATWLWIILGVLIIMGIAVYLLIRKKE